jgi:hypothetical protein
MKREGDERRGKKKEATEKAREKGMKEEERRKKQQKRQGYETIHMQSCCTDHNSSELALIVSA